MNKSHRISEFFSHYDERVKTGVIELCKTVSSTEADLFILMARKAASFFDCLYKLGLVRFNGIVSSDRILEMDSEWLRGKKVVIIDDAIISGTTIYETIRKLEKVAVKNIKVFVLAINSKYYQPELLENENAKSYLEKPYLVLKDEECIKMCADIIGSLSKFIRPYSVDFPVYSDISCKEKEFNQIVQTDEWEIDDISTANQLQENMNVLTFSPKAEVIRRLDETVGLAMSGLSFSKVRLYMKRIFSKGAWKYEIVVLPVVVLKPTYEKNIVRIFDHLTEHKTDRFKKHFTTTLSKVHFIQYVTAGVLAHIWHECIAELVPAIKALSQDKFNDSLLFNPFVSNLAHNSVMHHYRHKFAKDKVVKHVKVIADNKVTESIPEWHPTIDNLIGMQTSLAQPFIELFQDYELESRELVLKHGKKVFGMKQFCKKVDRLKRGYSINYLLRLLSKINLGKDEQSNSRFNKTKFVSLFLDKAIDLGIVVPIVAEQKLPDGGSYFYRAYRHGEDVIFGEMEFLLCTQLLDAFIRASNRTDKSVTHLTAEKLIVLFLKIGIQRNVFTQFIGNIPNLNSLRSEGVASIRNYLFGQITTFKSFEQVAKADIPIYLNKENSSNWVTKKLIRKNLIIKDRETDLYRIGKVDFKILDQKKKNEAIALGSFFGNLMNSKKFNLLKENDLVTLTSCLDYRDIAGSLAAEIVIFNNNWPDFFSFFNRNKLNPHFFFQVASNMRTNYNWISFTAINSGQDKFCRFTDGLAVSLIGLVEKKLEEADPFYSSNWSDLWSANLKKHTNEKEGNTISSIIEWQGSWLLKVNLLYRALEFALRKLAIIEKEMISVNNRRLLYSLVHLNYDHYELTDQYMIGLTGIENEPLQPEVAQEDLKTEEKIKITDAELLALLGKQNDKLLKKLAAEISEYKSKIEKYKVDKRLQYGNFSPLENDIDKFNNSQLRTLIWETIQNLEDLYFESKILISQVDEHVTPYGKPEIRVDYTDALFFDLPDSITETDKTQKYSALKTFVRKHKKRIFRKDNEDEEVSCFFQDGRDTYVKRGLWLFLSNVDKTELLNGFILIWNNFRDLKIRTYIFKGLESDHLVSKIGFNSKNTSFNYFWDLALSFILPNNLSDVQFDLRIITHRSNYQDDIRLLKNRAGELSAPFGVEYTFERKFRDRPYPHEAMVVACKFNEISERKAKKIKKQRPGKEPEKFRELFDEVYPKFDIGIIAIKETELAALLKGLDNVSEDVKAKSTKKYYSAVLQGKETTHRVVLCKQPDMGNIPASNMYKLMKDDFNPPLIIFFGTAGTYGDKAKLCDVLIPTKVIYYESGKDKPEGFEHEAVIFKINENFKDHFISDYFVKNGGEEISLTSSSGSYESTFTLTQGSLGSGEHISANPNSEVRGWLRNVDRKTIGFDMETAGAMAANDFQRTFTNSRDLGVLAIRALTDYGDPNKNSPDIEKYRTPSLNNALFVLKELFKSVTDLNKFVEKIYSGSSRA